MTENPAAKNMTDRRSELRLPSKKYHSVELKLASLPIYLFKLKDISPNGACFMVREGSAILKHLEEGQILNMRFHAEDELEPSEVFKSEIKYIRNTHKSPYKGHFAIGIMQLEKQLDIAFQDDE